MNFLDDIVGCLTHTHTSHNIHLREIPMLNAIYHYDEVRGEINPLYISWLFYTFCDESFFIYLFIFIYKQKWIITVAQLLITQQT
jgi:hypothetical protein